jgi:hypothetical protein
MQVLTNFGVEKKMYGHHKLFWGDSLISVNCVYFPWALFNLHRSGEKAQGSCWYNYM